MLGDTSVATVTLLEELHDLTVWPARGSSTPGLFQLRLFAHLVGAGWYLDATPGH